VNDPVRMALREALGPYRRAIGVVAALVVVFLLVPLVVILTQAFSGGFFFQFPPPSWSTRWFSQVLNDPTWQDAFKRSLLTASVGGVVATVCGTMAALALRRLSRGARLLRTLLLAPLVIPQLVLAIGIFVARDGLGFGTSLWTLVVGQTTLALPVVVTIASAGLADVDPALSRASQSLGHPWPSTVLRVELPLIFRSVLSALMLAFALCFDEAVLAFFLAPPGSPTLPTQLWQTSQENASPAIAAVSALVVAFVTLLLLLAAWLARPRRTRPTAPALATPVMPSPPPASPA
jgi:putative spermidine/putrescine transport system permease protein